MRKNASARTDDADLLLELVHRFPGLLLATGHHAVLTRFCAASASLTR